MPLLNFRVSNEANEAAAGRDILKQRVGIVYVVIIRLDIVLL